MLDVVEAQNIAIAALLAGAIVFFGAVYAIFYAFAMLNHSAPLLRVAYVGYLSLLGATIALAVVLQLTGWWMTVVVCILVGYFVAPRFIWRLSVAVHEPPESEPADEHQLSEVGPS